MRYKTSFEDFMKERHAAIFTDVLENVPGFYEWLATLSVDDWLEWGNIYAGLRSCADRSEVLKQLGV